jgi:hypothetical protein
MKLNECLIYIYIICYDCKLSIIEAIIQETTTLIIFVLRIKMIAEGMMK